MRSQQGLPVSVLGIDEAMPEQREYAAENEFFLEVWSAVETRVYGNIAVIKAEYRLEADDAIREGVDLLTLVVEGGGWKIINLTYEQSGFSRK